MGYWKADLLCSFDGEIYFTIQDTMMLKISRLSFSSNGMKAQTISLVTKLEICIPIQNLKPLTMTNIAKEIIVVYSERDNDTKFVILQPRDNPYDNHRITLLEIQYEPSEIFLVELNAKLDAKIRRNDFTDGGHEIN